MRALVISGGGSKGAFAGGVAEHLIADLGQRYDLFVGTSTGSLLLPHLALGKLDKLKKIFTNIANHDVFSVYPFQVKKGPEGYRTRMNHWSNLWMFLRRKNTFGDSAPLRLLIENAFSREEFDTLRSSPIRLVVTVSNLTAQVVEYKHLDDCTYEDFIDWMWCSSNVVPFMSLVEKGGFQYADGGFGNLVPIHEAINLGATSLDVIVLSPRHRAVRLPETRNPFASLLRTHEFMLQQISRSDIFSAQLEGIYSNIRIRFFYTPRILTQNPYIFDREELSTWWDEGRAFARLLLMDQGGLPEM